MKFDHRYNLLSAIVVTVANFFFNALLFGSMSLTSLLIAPLFIFPIILMYNYTVDIVYFWWKKRKARSVQFPDC